MTKVLQGNMNGTILADTLLEQWIAEEAPDVLLLSEPYRNRNDRRWIVNADGRAAVWVPSGRPITRQGTGQDHALATVANTTFVSVYLSPNLSAGDFDTRLAELEDTLRDIPGDLVIGGDFNARSTEWGMLSTNRRGRAVVDMAARLGLQVANQGSVFTYK